MTGGPPGLSDPTPVVIYSEPGIQRDGTLLAGDAHVDADWCRWQRRGGRVLPRKVGGYRKIADLSGPVRGLHMHNIDDQAFIHAGWSDGIQRIAIDRNSSVIGGSFDRTPVGFTPNANNEWKIVSMRNLAASNTAIIAHAAPNLDDIANQGASPIYIGDIAGTAPLTQIADPLAVADGGITVLAPYLFLFGSNGRIRWSDANQPTTWTGGDANGAFITDQKIVAGMPYRGGPANAPSGIFWSLNSVIRAGYVGGPAVFRFDTLSSQSSILSSNSIVEYDGLFFWCGLDRFLVFNGTVNELPNSMCLNYFYDHVNYAHVEKVFGFKVPRYGEIWWCYPRDNATECTHAVIFNVREKCWYDVTLPSDFRTAAYFAQVYRYPIATSISGTGTAALWQHEYGVNKVFGANTQPIKSYYETGDINWLIPQGNAPPRNTTVTVRYVEPDFIQTGEMKFNVTGRANARAGEVVGPDYPFQPDTQVVYPKEQRRELRFRFESNVVDGDYQAGISLAHITTGDGTVLG
jgi:hypothetical protein